MKTEKDVQCLVALTQLIKIKLNMADWGLLRGCCRANGRSLTKSSSPSLDMIGGATWSNHTLTIPITLSLIISPTIGSTELDLIKLHTLCPERGCWMSFGPAVWAAHMYKTFQDSLLNRKFKRTAFIWNGNLL